MIKFYFGFSIRVLLDLRFLMSMAIEIQLWGKKKNWMIFGVFNLVFFHVLFWLWSLIDVSDVFYRERSRDDALTVVRDRKVSPNSLTLHPLHCILYISYVITIQLFNLIRRVLVLDTSYNYTESCDFLKLLVVVSMSNRIDTIS